MEKSPEVEGRREGISEIREDVCFCNFIGTRRFKQEVDKEVLQERLLG